MMEALVFVGYPLLRRTTAVNSVGLRILSTRGTTLMRYVSLRGNSVETVSMS